ncbi:aminoglycoside phosphotransferase family protein [Pseudoroseicyclus tamaricis]|uniref:Phosphotransferase n=1 Tax=Pseudoroseicyclus tamaricis TaxID=2705421 RepID=A0A6B2JS66_9RHOB|nr:aminoglycoside phosphotransferase family protein [Pseudoroseicyclus tamaricis]NDV01058.1 phosphotransferase [Pseudoroseicyclus tamaricis]
MSGASRLAALLRLWQLGPLTPVAETRSSRIYRCDSPQGPAALKLLTEAGAEERRGATALRHWQGHAAARLYAEAPGAMLLEWLPGPPLGDRVRTHGDAGTFPALAALIHRLHHAPSSLVPENPREGAAGAGGRQPPSDAATLAPLLPLQDMFAPLLTSQAAHLARPRAIARRLLSAPRPPVVLHGDLHHDNIIETPEGWRAIDPKGLIGDPGFEAANLFRNPVGRRDLALAPARIEALARALAPEEPGRPIAWAIALCGISQIWNAGTPHDDGIDAEMASALAAVLADVPKGQEWA